MNRSDPKQSVRELLEEAHPALIGLSHWIHANPEVGFEEHHASDWVNEWLQTAGFEIERGVADMPTALVGRFGPGPFHVAICVEYDALPEVGHACGHNIIAAAGVGAGLALASVADELGLRVSVMGTPAEESGGGKLGFIEAGLFEDVHAAAMVHPWPADIVSPNVIAITQLDVTYRGHEAHAAGFPHLGRNAADALVVAQTAIGLLRQQLLASDRVHGIVTKGGDAPNIIPALTTAHYMIRASDSTRLDQVVALVTRCFEAGALATGTELEIVEGTRYAHMVHDADLAALYRHNAEQLGRVFDDGPGVPLSTDMADVSHVVPSIHPMIAIDSNGAVNHQREFAEACASPSADQAILDGALGLAWTVIDAAQSQVIRARLMGEADIREAVAIVEEVQELDAHADVLEGLAAAVADEDPALAERIAAAADALETRADELADEADSRFEHAQELADEALLDEVTGELESDVEDLVAAIEPAVVVVELEAEGAEGAEGMPAEREADLVDLLAVASVVEALAEADETPLGAWEAAPVAEASADGEVDAQGGLETFDVIAETSEPDDDHGWQAAPALDETVADAEPEVVSGPAAAASLGEAHALWERDFLVIVRHAAWEEEFAVALVSVTEPSDATDAVAEAPDAVAEPEPLEAVAEAEPLEAVAEPEPEAEAPEVVAPVASAGFELRAELGTTWDEPSDGPFEAIADDGTEFEGELDELVVFAESAAEAPVEPVADIDAAAPVAQDAPWQPAEATPVASAEPDAIMTSDDIWYSGAPDEDLPSAELVPGAPIAVAASADRADEFVWVPAEDEDR